MPHTKDHNVLLGYLTLSPCLYSSQNQSTESSESELRLVRNERTGLSKLQVRNTGAKSDTPMNRPHGIMSEKDATQTPDGMNQSASDFVGNTTKKQKKGMKSSSKNTQKRMQLTKEDKKRINQLREQGWARKDIIKEIGCTLWQYRYYQSYYHHE